MKAYVRLLAIALLAIAAPGLSSPQKPEFPVSWTEPIKPFHIVGPVYYVGTRGIGVYLLKSDAGLLLLSGAPSGAASAVINAVKDLGFKPEDIRLILSSHAHFDHAGTLAAHKKASGAKLVAMESEVDLLKSGGQLDFLFSNRPEFSFQGVTTDRAIKDKEQVTLGNITLTAHHTPGHTKGCITWQMSAAENGRTYNVVFADGVSVNPGTRFVKNPSYQGISEDYQATFRVLEGLKPDIFLAYHAEHFDLEAKLKRAPVEGVKAWVDPRGYRELLEKRKASYEKFVQEEKR